MRTAAHPIDPQFTKRSSPRAMSGAPVSRENVLTLLEAARWSPSGGNGQPWLFAYALPETETFKSVLDALVPANQVWCVRAGAFVIVASNSVRPDGKPHGSHAFDAGAAWMALALQGSKMDLVVHAMGGFDGAKLRAALSVPETVVVHCVVAIGHTGNVQDLPESLRAREEPNDRKPLAEIAAEGAFPSAASR